MEHARRSILKALAAACALPAAPLFAAPLLDKQISVIVGYPPGGTGDSAARKLADKLRGIYASTLIIENKPGARGVPAANAVLSLPPDGSALYVAPSALATLWPHVYRNLPYDPVTDFTPVTSLAGNDFALAVAANLPVTNLAQYIDWAHADPTRALYGTLGPGSLPEFIGYAFAQAAGIRLTPVPYRGAAPGVIDLVSGQIPSWVGPLGDVAVHAKAGRVRMLATAGTARSVFTPNITTFAQAGFPAASIAETWGVFVRAGTPAPLVDKLAGLVADAVGTADFSNAMTDQYFEPRACTPKEYAALIEHDRAVLAKVVAASGFHPEA